MVLDASLALQVDARITFEIGRTREIESAIVLCQDEVRNWEEEERKWLQKHCAFATQAEDFEVLNGEGGTIILDEIII